MSGAHDFDLTGLVAIVTGATGWLGRAMTAALAEAGADVTVVARTREPLDALAAEYTNVTAHACDVSTPAWADLVSSTADRSGRLDILVNNAHMGRGDTIATADPSSYAEAVQVSVGAAVAAMNAGRPGFSASVAAGGSPSVINVASMYGMVSPDPGMYATARGTNPPYYGVAKAGLLQLTRYAAAEFGRDGVRVNSLTPGPFPQHPGSMDPAFVAELSRRTMLGRYGNPDDIRTAVLFLASPMSRFVTGSNVVVDGGWTSW